MEMKILVIGLSCYKEHEIKEIIDLLKNEHSLKKLPSSNHYLLVYIPDYDETDIREEMERISKNHSNPAWEIINRKINNQKELEALPHQLYHQES